ncbi:L-dopachrome tautomerase-related protein [Pseudomonas syringae]|uniref:L-dopachrome tautomerase-related protein n=2 Tax=Pseudomonas syringae TaxID=317 RepID=UPI0002098B32|nr:L-dopachrome tautomerase-related protein [Pseudomonas syringae]EGH71575.1 Glyoxalase/bleomycin resistance protein/dioxygenase [Pseudomonas syringae pv. aceris str. M302273]KOG03465.1 Glyoxalase/bleomycin resistance protein/dioxygenase [Pseudomonas syringae pv. aceris]
MKRRTLIKGAVLAAALPSILPSLSFAAGPALTTEVSASTIVNAVAATRDGTLFVGMPRWNITKQTPSLARVDGPSKLTPFPGGAWNEWAPGKDVANAFVQVNSVHVFDDDTVWIVDQGAPDNLTTLRGAAKVAQFDSKTGKVLRVLRFDATILPHGAVMNDLRIFANHVYITDAGVGGLIVHDLTTGKTLRHLHNRPLLRQPTDRPIKATGGRLYEDQNGKRPQVHADMLEVTSDGEWLLFSTPSSDMYKIPLKLLNDPAVNDDELERHIVKAFDKGTINGTCIDSLGNVYLGLVESRSIGIVAPDGRRATLLQDDRLIGPDALFIDANRRLLIPATQGELMANFNRGVNGTSGTFEVYSLALPESADGILLGKSMSFQH